MNKDIALAMMADAQRRAERHQALIAIAALARHFGQAKATKEAA